MSIEAEFTEFWKSYPRKVGKLAARRAYERARRIERATHTEILTGVGNYIEHKPSYADYAHPSTWLMAGRWMDEWEAAVQPARKYWADECQELHNGTCDKRWTHEMRKKEPA